MRKTIFILLLLCHISLLATDKKAFEWIYNDDKSCSVYLEKTDTKDRRIFWSGKCPNKKINGYGILLLTGVKDDKREKLVQTKGLAHNGIMNGKVFLRFYNKYGTRGSYIIKDDNIKANTTAYFIYPDYNHIVKETFKENAKNEKKAIKKSDNPTEYKKAEKLVYKHETVFKNSLTKCENKTHNFKLNLYEYNLDSMHSYNDVLLKLKDLFTCQLEHKQYKDLITITNNFLQTIDNKEKKTFEGRLAEVVGISYYHVQDYKNSLNYFLKAKDFLYFKETRAILENKSMKVYGKEKAKTIISKMILNEITSTTFLLSFYKDEKSIRDIIKETKQKIDINSKNSNGETILTQLSYNDNPLVIKLLIESGANVNLIEKDGTTALMKASMKGNFEVTKILLKNKANLDITTKEEGYTALIYAVLGDKVDIVKLLLKNKANPNITTRKKGNTALIYATFKENFDLSNLLLRYNANPNIENNDGYTALMLVLQIKTTDIQYKILESLIQNGGNVNHKYKKLYNRLKLHDYYTLLHRVTASTNNPKLIEMLIKGGAVVNIKTPSETTPLSYAIDEKSQWEHLINLGKTVDKLAGMLGVDDESKEENDIKIPYRYPSEASVKLLKDAGAH